MLHFVAQTNCWPLWRRYSDDPNGGAFPGRAGSAIGTSRLGSASRVEVLLGATHGAEMRKLMSL